jgi:hypothetical protein
MITSAVGTHGFWMCLTVSALVSDDIGDHGFVFGV